MRRLWRDLRELRSEYERLNSTEVEEEQQASLEIAATASDFSRRARKVVDDKLAFSATLMRAGEVEAATQVIAELENDVLAEEAALMEKVNEVRVERAAKRERMTRLRLARSLAVAMLGSLLLSASALGVTLTNAIDEEPPVALTPSDQDQAGNAPAAQAPSSAKAARMRGVKIAGVKVRMNQAQMRAYSRLTSGDAVSPQVQQYLLSILPERVQNIVTAAGAILTADAPVDPEPEIVLPKEIRKMKKEAASHKQEPADEKPTPSPSAEPTDPADEEPDPDPSPNPSPSPTDDEKDGGELPIDPDPTVHF